MTRNTPSHLVHICHCSNDAENVQSLIQGRADQRLLLFYDSLDIGPLKEIDTPSGIRSRETYFNQILAIDKQFVSESLVRVSLGINVLSRAPAAHEAALIWVGEITCEQMMLRAVCAYWPDTELWLADVTRLKPWYPNTYPAVPCFSPEALARLETMRERISPADKLSLAREWHALSSQDHVLRTYKDGKVLGVPEDFFDAFLWNACTHEWQFQARVAGACQAESGFSQVGDSYLLYRLHLMAERGLVVIQGNDPDYRLHKIRKR